jgi:hypothetical protein
MLSYAPRLCLSVRRQVRLAYLVVLFVAVAAGVGNGTGHLLASAALGRHFPGLPTAPFCLLAGTVLLVKLFGGARTPGERCH